MDENEVKQEENIETNTTNTTSEDKKINVCGLLSFIFSLVGLFIFGFPLGVASIILGIIGIIKFDKEKQKFKWMGIVGLCVGVFDIIGVLLSIAMLVSLL